MRRVYQKPPDPRGNVPGENGALTKYTDETIEKLVQAIELGATHEHACNYAGISYNAFLTWRREKEGFEDLMIEAEGRAAIKWLAKIEKEASRGTWQAAAWKLERRYPETYGRSVRTTEQVGPGGGPIQHTLEVTIKENGLEAALAMLTPEQLAQLSDITRQLDDSELLPLEEGTPDDAERADSY